MQNRFSPLRYPGGKGKLTDYIRLIFEENGFNDGHYVEPYAGGAAVALSLLFLENATHVHINDLNRSIYAFWHSVLNSTDELCRKIQDKKVTLNEWSKQKQVQSEGYHADLLDLGYSTFFLNRTNRSGIIKGGMIGGNAQSGEWKIDARFNKIDLIKRIEKIAQYNNRISVYNLDACELLKILCPHLPEKTLIYLDPPYYIKGQGLYQNYYKHEDHVMVGQTVQQLKHSWVVSYDNTPPIHNIYHERRKIIYDIGYSANDAYKGSEVFIFSDNLIMPEEQNPFKVAC